MSTVPTYGAISEFVGSLEGWMTPAQGSQLFAAAQRCPEGGCIVEIGSFRGKSTVVLASAAPASAEVIAIDPHAGNDRGPGEIDGYAAAASEDHEVFLATLARGGVADRVRHVRRFSAEAHDEVQRPIDVLYVDGAHRYRPALEDLRNWGAKVVPGGTLLVHDAFSSVGVTLAIGRSLSLGTRFRYVGRDGSLAEFCADLGPGRRERLRNMVRLAAQLPWFVRNVGLKVVLSVGPGRRMLERWARRRGRTAPQWPY